MIVVTVELVSAIDGHRETLGTAYIANDGQGTPTQGDYDVVLHGRDRSGLRPHGPRWKQGKVEGFPRQRLLGWDLVYRALKACGLGERNDA